MTGVVRRVGVILAELAEAATPLSLAELTCRTGLPKTTVHRLLASLCSTGLVRRADVGYLLGPAASPACDPVPDPAPLTLPRRCFLPHLVELYERTHQMVSLCVLVGDEVVVIERIYGHDRADDGADDVDRVPAGHTAAGRVLLAFAWAVRSDEGLERCLAGIRRRRVAVHTAACNAGVICAAAPVVGRAGRVVAAVEIAGGSPAMGVTAMVDQVRRTALAISAAARCLG
ncbi:IclR family transcriptional regulator [Streptomyces chattanoogensis]|uniref:IclR family transcriptional regulator n=1 Tax=Streptomyces chattanoogensis TaxID=66876 RepID=UPI0036B09634